MNCLRRIRALLLFIFLVFLIASNPPRVLAQCSECQFVSGVREQCVGGRSGDCISWTQKSYMRPSRAGRFKDGKRGLPATRTPQDFAVVSLVAGLMVSALVVVAISLLSSKQTSDLKALTGKTLQYNEIYRHPNDTNGRTAFFR